MALTLAELETMRDELVKARSRGVRMLQVNGERVEYKTDAELAAAFADLDRQIANLSRPKIGAVTFSTSKGL